MTKKDYIKIAQILHKIHKDSSTIDGNNLAVENLIDDFMDYLDQSPHFDRGLFVKRIYTMSE